MLRCREAFKVATLLLRPAAGQLLLFSINNLDGGGSVSERDDIITHYSRTGKGTQISRDVRPQVDAAIDDIERITDARVITFSADTAYHNLIDYASDGKPKNIIALQYETFNQSKKNKPLKNLEIIKDYIENQPFHLLEIPHTWTEKKKGEVRKPPYKIFPNLGDQAMEDQMKILNFPLNPLIDVPAGHSENEIVDEVSESEIKSENDEEDQSTIVLPLKKKKVSQILSLKETAEKALLRNKNFLVIVAAQLQFPSKYEEYKSRVPISDQLILPGLSDRLDLISSPEVSKIKGHLRGSFIDLTHSGTRLRANATSRDVLMGSSSAFHYIAKEGSTALKLTHVEDRCDMMSEDICRVRMHLLFLDFYYFNFSSPATH